MASFEQRLSQAHANGVVIGLLGSGSVVARLDIDQLLTREPLTFNLFLLALAKLQTQPDKMGYFQIAGMFIVFTFRDILTGCGYPWLACIQLGWYRRPWPRRTWSERRRLLHSWTSNVPNLASTICCHARTIDLQDYVEYRQERLSKLIKLLDRGQQLSAPFLGPVSTQRRSCCHARCRWLNFVPVRL